MHCSCSALAATWISELHCLLESLWSHVWINASTWQGSILIQGASATSSHCTLREARKQPRPPRCPKSLGSSFSHPPCRWWMGSFPGTAPKNNSPCASAPWMLMSSSFHQLYGILIPFPPPRGRSHIPLHHCSVCWQVQGCPEPHYRPTFFSWPPNKWPSLWKRHFFSGCLTQLHPSSNNIHI